ncbi:MAG TPA: hypothetical protein VF950_16575, partial [Planctomycetota bacterium]
HALKLKDAEAVVAFDRGLGGDVLSTSFGGDDDPRRADLRGALEAALAHDPTEIVLHSDGREDPGSALLLCKARGVPVHTLPLGPSDVRDIRFVRVRAPADAAPAERFPIEVALEATWSVKARVRLGDDVRELDLAAGAPASLVFPDRAAGEHRLAIETPDDVPQNDALTVRVLPRTSRRRVVAIPGGGLPALADVDLVPDLAGAHAVIVNGPVPDAAAIVRYARDGGGVLFVGGPASRWDGTPLEEISPVRFLPDHKVAVVFAIDTSGSMEKHLETVRLAVDETRALLGEKGLIPMAFADGVTELSDWSQLRRKPDGATNFKNALEWCKKRLEIQEDAGRKHVLLFTDGVTADEEKPEARAAAAKALRDAGIGLTVITIQKELDIARPNVPLKDVDQLVDKLREIFAGIRDTYRERPGRLDVHPHPVTAGLGAPEPAGLYLTTLKPGAQVAATWGPAVYPAIAFTQAGHGKSGAILFAPDATLLSRALAHVARPSGGAYRLTVEPPLVRARGPGTSPRLLARAGGLEFPLLQVRSDVWEGVLPETRAGTVLVELAEGGLAAAVVPCLPELARVGVDLPALERIAAETGGRPLTGSADLATLPPPPGGGTRSGRTLFLLAALAAIFCELAISTFWKAR